MCGAMPGAVAEPLTIAAFRTWYESRPDHEHWELIAGVPTLKQRAARGRRRIASNLDRMLIDALQAHCPERVSYQRIGINLASVAPGYDPEPDVIVVDDGGYEERYSDRFYLVAEIVEPSDRKTVESKCAIYKRHPRVPMRAHAPAKSGPHRHCGVDGCRLDRPCADRTG